ncbi:MAG: hypothetical protein EZS28_036995, partial [Streblomastix strix]
MSTVTGSSFVKYGADDTVVLLGAGGTKPISEFAGTPTEVDAKLTNVVITNTTQSINGAKTFNANVNATSFVKTSKNVTSVLPTGGGDRLLSSFVGIEDLESIAFSGNCNAGTINPDYLVIDDTAVATCIPFPNSTIDKEDYVMITHSTGPLLDAAGLSEFPELYAYIHVREPKPIVDGIVSQIIVGPQYLQDQVKDNDDKLSVQPPPPTLITPIPVVAEVITELWLFSKRAQVLRDDGGHKQNIMSYISEKGPYIVSSNGSVDQITPIKGNTYIAIEGVYCADFEPLKRAVSDANGDGKINIVDDWHINSIIYGMKSLSWVQDVVQKQTEAIGDGVQPCDLSIPVSLSNYFNNNTKLVNHKIFDPIRAAYFVKEGPTCTFNFQAEVNSQHVNNVFTVFQTIDSDLQPWLPNFFPIKTSYISFAGMIQINGNDTPDVVVNQGFGYYHMDLCDFRGSYLIDPQPQESNQNNITSNGEPISHIDSIIMQHDTIPSVPIPPSVFPQYTVTEVSRDQILALAYTPYDLDAFKIYIIDDTFNKLVMFNMHLRQKGFIDTKQN